MRKHLPHSVVLQSGWLKELSGVLDEPRLLLGRGGSWLRGSAAWVENRFKLALSQTFAASFDGDQGIEESAEGQYGRGGNAVEKKLQLTWRWGLTCAAWE